MLHKYTKYDYRVQIMRILACFIVICCHVRVEPIADGVLDATYLLFYVLFNDGVTIFFLIMGFFLFASKGPLRKQISKIFIKILLPIFFMNLCIQLFDGWIINETTFKECFMHPSIDLKSIVKKFISLNFATGNYSSHLWYINSYLHIVIALPLLKLLTLDTPLAQKAFKWLIFINITDMFLTDFQMLFSQSGLIIGSFRILGNIPVAFVLIGYLAYKKQPLFIKSARHRFLFVIGMIGITVLRYGLHYMFWTLGLENNYHNYWNTTFSLIFSICFVGFFLTFSSQNRSRWTRIINYVGTKTYIIYLIHVSVYTFGDYHGIRKWLYSVTVQVISNPFTKLCYDIIYPIIVFACCLIITIFIDFIKNAFLFVFSAFKKRHKI